MGRTEEGHHCPSKINLRILINDMEIIEFLNCVISLDKEFGQLNGQLRAKYRHLGFSQEIRQSTNGIRMTVGQEDPSDTVTVFKKVVHIWNDHIHP